MNDKKPHIKKIKESDFLNPEDRDIIIDDIERLEKDNEELKNTLIDTAQVWGYDKSIILLSSFLPSEL